MKVFVWLVLSCLNVMMLSEVRERFTDKDGLSSLPRVFHAYR
jgi:hypothetical protein